MQKRFNTTGDCKPQWHYMVDITDRLIAIKKMIDRNDYFTINRARQYGKTTTLQHLERFLQDDYAVIHLDFQALSHSCFASEAAFTSSFLQLLQVRYSDFVAPVQAEYMALVIDENADLFALFQLLSKCCGKSKKPAVMFIDEVDSASNNQVFLDFLAQLRLYYLNRDTLPTFQSVVLAGVHDVKNLKMKIHPDKPSKKNSPWNIAANFNLDMSFSVRDIAGMLADYEKDYATGMDIDAIANLIHDYTAGYPFLTSSICQLMDEQIAGTEKLPTQTSAWTKEGILQAVKLLINEKNTLFDSLINKMEDFEEIGVLVKSLLFEGRSIPYNPDESLINTIIMFGFAKRSEDNGVVISNRIFEMRLYNYFIAKELLKNRTTFHAAENYKSQFIENDQLNLERILEKFVQHFNDIYGDKPTAFKEEEGRKYFLLYLKPIINGVGNYYIEAQTRDMRRTDVIIDYLGKQYIIEMKIWHGEEYNTRGERQLSEYLDYYHLQTGYMLSFNFNQSKQVGIKQIEVGGKTLVEAVV